jgi:hypothetical protein
MGKPTGLAKEQNRALDRLASVVDRRRYYLAGGSAVAWHLGHRQSNDLDLFSNRGNANLDRLRESLGERIPGARMLAASDVALRFLVENVLVDIVRYRYPPLEPPAPGPGGFPVAGLRDLAAMKLATIAGRGLCRDFWDLYEILHSGLSIEEAAAAYLERFGLSEPDLYHLSRALTYFSDAEADPTRPKGLSKRKWETITAFFQGEAPKLLRAPTTTKSRRSRRARSV